MSPGKLAAQVAHASMAFLTRRLEPTHFYNRNTCKLMLSTAEREWLDESFAKVVLGVDSEAELEAIAKRAESGFQVHRVVDEGRTELKGPTFTCVAIGPQYSFLLDDITGHLKLY